ncbi:homing endonuclease associated repeat-containing protein [Bacillus sp. PM8313]|uniref:homing endonuclease associated repeat-containing protein n=1 Tax=Bacillus TaxID=1386 RepID=UPI001CC8F2AE|nr:hypothetical protein K9N56_24205 [Bacillus sp. PM8313]
MVPVCLISRERGVLPSCSPRHKEVQQATTMQFRFGSWNKALEAAGLKIYEAPKKDQKWERIRKK